MIGGVVVSEGHECRHFLESHFFFEFVVVIGFWDVELLVDVFVVDGYFFGDAGDDVPLFLKGVPVLIGCFVPDVSAVYVEAESFEDGAELGVEY